MCIDAAVGDHLKNTAQDVKIVQALLNLDRPIPLRQLTVDGKFGKETGDAIAEFETRAMKTAKPTGRVDPGGPVLTALRAAIPQPPFLSDMMIKGIMPSATFSKIGLYLPYLKTGMASRSINSLLRQAHFLAQLGHESGSFVYSEELASGAAYEGRQDLGNTEPGDGVRFKGRGLIQLTGRSNYEAYGVAVGKNLTDGVGPKLVSTDPSLATDVACWFWSTHDLNMIADTDDIRAITRVVNGGLNGLADREAYLRRAKFFFGL